MKKRYLSFIGAMLCIASLSGCSLSGNEASQAAVLQEQPETVRMAGMEEVQREISGDSESTSGTPIVYMTTDISPEGLMWIYEALGLILLTICSLPKITAIQLLLMWTSWMQKAPRRFPD